MLRLVHREFVVDAPLDQAWDHLAQVEAWVSWAKHIRRVELVPQGDVTAETTGTLYLSNWVEDRI